MNAARITALVVAAVTATALPALADSTSTTIRVTVTVPPLCQDFQRADGSRTTVCNGTHAITAPPGATPIGSAYAAAADGRAPLVIYSADGATRTVTY